MVGVKECSKEDEDCSQMTVFDFQEVYTQFSNNYIQNLYVYTTNIVTTSTLITPWCSCFVSYCESPTIPSSWTTGTGVVPWLDLTGDYRRETQQGLTSLLPHQRKWYQSFTVCKASGRHLTHPDQEGCQWIWTHWNWQKVWYSSSIDGFLHDQLNFG